MKICFELQRRFAFVGNYLAMILQTKYNQQYFCGYVNQRSSYDFLKQQTDIRYSGLILDEDIQKKYKNEKLDLPYIRSLEKEYGLPSLWPFLTVDRIRISSQLIREYPFDNPLFTHEEMLLQVQVYAKSLTEFLDKEKPDCIIFSVIGNLATMLLNQFALKRGIKVFHIITAPLIERFGLSERYDTLTWVDEHFKQNMGTDRRNQCYEDAKKYLAEFQNNPYPYDEIIAPEKQPVHRSQQMSFLTPHKLFASIRWFSHVLYEYIITSYRKDYSYIHPLNYIKDRLKRKLRNLRGLNDLYDVFDDNEDFAFFPLHFEPEVSLSLLAPYATDQIHVIKQIAHSLPITFKLYIKEHPLMVPYRPRSYYQELKKIPNVKLINPVIPSWEIIPKAKLVTVITGSVGWESLLFKKPVISFGDQFYNVLSMVKRCHDYEQLPYIIKEQLENFHYNEEELLQYIACVFEDTAELPLSYIWDVETDEIKKKAGLEPLADLLAKKLNLIPAQTVASVDTIV